MSYPFILTTGGTIGADSYLDPENPPEYSTFKTVKGRKNPVLKLLNERFEGNKVHCCLKNVDSKDIDTEYRYKIWHKFSRYPRNLGTHGTDEILQTARWMNTVKQPGQRNILTGSMIPLTNGEASDGIQNFVMSMELLISGEAPEGTSIVLSDYDEQGFWKPKLYRPDQLQWLTKHRNGSRSRLVPMF